MIEPLFPRNSNDLHLTGWIVEVHPIPTNNAILTTDRVEHYGTQHMIPCRVSGNEIGRKIVHHRLVEDEAMGATTIDGTTTTRLIQSTTVVATVLSITVVAMQVDTMKQPDLGIVDHLQGVHHVVEATRDGM